MYNLVVSDLDGTLLNEKHNVSDNTKKILIDLKKSGVNIVLATGRPYMDAKRIVDYIGINIPVICSNGAILVDEDGKYIHKYFLEKEQSNYLIEFNEKEISEEIYLNTIIEDDWYIHEKIEEDHFINEFVDENWNYEIIEKNKLYNENITKFFYIGPHEKLLELEKKVKEFLKDDVNYAFTLPECIEIFPKNATKAKALEKLSEIKGYNLDKSLGFGDGFNDVEFLQLVKKGHLMGNAPESLKKQLKNIEVIDFNYNDAVYFKLKEIFERGK